METLKINKNNFWIKLYCFLYCCDKSFRLVLPDNICDLRKALIIGIPFGILFFPVILVLNIIKYAIKEPLVFNIKERIAPYIISVIITFFSCLIFSDCFVKSLGIVGFLGQTYLFTFILILLIAIAVAIALLIALLCIKTYEVIYKQLDNKKGIKESKTKVIKELYLSVKEKYCKKIEYVD